MYIVYRDSVKYNHLRLKDASILISASSSRMLGKCLINIYQ